jgi:tetratricopeptide (TPR) repeat protein
MVVIPSMSKFTPFYGASLCRSAAVILAVCLCSCPAFARSRNRSGAYQNIAGIDQLDAALKSNDVESAQAMAAAMYQQATNAVALTSTNPTVIIDPVMAAQSLEFTRAKTAFDIAACFYRHAELDVAKQWATTTTTGGTLSEQYVRLATVLLGNIATAMDNNDEAVADFTSVISLAGQYHEQPAAYAGLLEILMLQNHNDLVEQWVQRGQTQFAGADNLKLDFLKKASVALKRRNHPLWRQLDQQIVGLSSTSAGSKLQALRELASNARKFGRWAEAETNYAAICALPATSAQDTVDSYLFLAECQAKQGEDITATLQSLTTKSTMFTKSEDREYATYRAAKFYDGQGNLGSAAASYKLVASGSSTSSWAAAAFHQLGALKEQQGDLQGALQLYMQYPQRFPQDQKFAIRSYGNALNVAMALGDTNTAGQIVGTITNNAAAIQDYNTQLHLAFYFHKRGKDQLAVGFLEGGLRLAQQTLRLTPDIHQRSLIHYQILRRMNDFAWYQRMLDYFTAHASDLANADSSPDDYQLQCRCYKAMAVVSTGHRQQGLDELHELLDQAQANPELEAKFAEILAIYYNTPTERATALELFEWAAQKYPAHPWVNIGRLDLAIQRFNAGDYTAAQKLTDDITNALSENAKMSWIRATYWGAVYLRGCCVQAKGGDGTGLKQLALSKVPGLRIQNRLRTI